MPVQAPHRCLRCKALVVGPCPVCAGPWARRPASWPGGAGDRRWRRVRAQRLRLDPACAWCGSPATQADHLDGTDYRDDSGQGTSWLNLAMTRSLCVPCHRVRTGRQGGTAARY